MNNINAFVNVHFLLDRKKISQAPNKIPADIVFIIRDKPHPHFKYDPTIPFLELMNED